MSDRSISPDEPVVAAACGSYDIPLIRAALESADPYIGMDSLKGKKVVVKPNFVAKRAPDEAATVHPAVLAAVTDWLADHGADNIVLAESPGGVYNAVRLRGIYAATGADDIAKSHPVTLNYDCAYSEVPVPDGHICRLFDIIGPILDADVIVDVSKLKTHALTGMSAAVKNMFGTIPGIVKFEMHSRYPDYGDFSEMLVDLCEFLCRRASFISVTDAVVAMEGNGPTNGTPRHVGAILVSRNPFAADAAASRIIGGVNAETVKRSAARGLAPAPDDCRIVKIGDIDDAFLGGFTPPDSADRNMIEIVRNLFGGRVYKLFAPYPVVDYSVCFGCGECAASCPRHTIVMTESDAAHGKKRAPARVPKIERDGCIRCFCCQELCPRGAVRIKKNPITRLLS